MSLLKKHPDPERKPMAGNNIRKNVIKAQNDELLLLILPHLEYQQDKRASNGDYLCKCVFHNHNHPDKYKMNVGFNGWYCNSAGEGGSLGELARHLRIKLNSNTEAIHMDANEVVYDYTDEKGDLLFQVVRKPGKKFSQRRIVNGDFMWNLKGVRRVPYRLKELLESMEKDEPVFICEGEKDVDNVRKLGLTATCNPCGAGKWKKEYCDYLKGRDLVLIPDNDESGKAHMQQVAEMCSGVANSIRIIDLPDLIEKQDISDWLEKGHTKEELFELVEESPELEPSDEDGESEDTERSKYINQATDLIQHIKAQGIMLFHDERKKAYAQVKTDEGQETMPIHSGSFLTWLYCESWDFFARAVNNETINAVRNHLESEAIYKGPQHDLSVRYARQNGSIFIDLDGYKAVRVDENGWQLIDNPPPLFRWFPHMKPIQRPAGDGDPWELLKFLNISDEDEKILVLCFILVSMIKGVPIPVLILNGYKGTAKTTALKIIRTIIDPSCVPVRGTVPDQGEFSLMAWQNRVIFFDNLNSIPAWFSDALCRAITGEGYSKRSLYTDEDTTFFQYDGIFGIASINQIADKPDLLDRALIVNMKPIPRENRLLESKLLNKFENELPSIYSGFYTKLTLTLKIAKDLQVENYPRMADFAFFGTAAAIALGKTREDFQRAYDQNIYKQNEAAIDASYVAQAVISFTEKQNGAWVGTASELLDNLNEMRDKILKNQKASNWPQDPGWLSRRLRDVIPNLLELGITVEFTKSAFGRVITIYKDEKRKVNLVIKTLKNENDDIETTDSGDDVA
jgi:hypothetical protein